MSFRDRPMSTEDWGTRNRSMSIRSLAKLTISMAEGKFSSREISLAASISGLMVMDRFKPFWR